MSLFNGVSMSLQRYAAGTYVKGKWVEGSAGTAVAITGSFQPLTGKELQALPEGRRERSIYKGFTSYALRTTDPHDQTPRDVITVNGMKYEIFQVKAWQNGILNHFEFLAEQVKEGVSL